KYPDTRFLRVVVANVPWLVEKLGIKPLPCVIVLIDGVTRVKINGFEPPGNIDDFLTFTLEIHLEVSGM
ncbi:hypothetical protein CPB86DRAFT_672482, partial [Serendipita vermifera]